MTSDHQGSVGLGIGLAAATGFSLTLGTLTTFCQKNGSSSQYTLLSVSLALASGVLFFVSFTQLYPTATAIFEDEGQSNPAGLTLLCFTAGWVFTYGLDKMVHYCCGGPSKSDEALHGLPPPAEIGSREVSEEKNLQKNYASNENNNPANDHELNSHNEQTFDGLAINNNPTHPANPMSARLKHMTFITSLAIGIHNMPEGLAVLVATLDAPALGASLAVAVALHNLPIGICIASPIYVSTGSRWKAFLATFVVGATQPLGAIIGYYIFEAIFTKTVYAILYAGVAGMMAYITIKELLPTARLYEKRGDRVNFILLFGFVLVALITSFTHGHHH